MPRLFASWLCVAVCSCASSRGTSPWVKRFELHGNRHFSDAELLDGLSTQKTGWWPFAKKQPFLREAFEIDVDRLETVYKTRGFFDVKIVRQDVVRDPRSAAVSIVVGIDEGKPTFIRAIELGSVSKIPQRLLRTDNLAIKRGHRFDYARYQHARREIEERLKRAGYAYAQVKPRVLIKQYDRRAVLRYVIDAGPLVRIARIAIRGHRDLPRKKLLRLVEAKPGQVYHPDMIGETRSRLLRQRVFSTVQVALPDEATANADLQINAPKGPLRELQLGGGFGIERRRQEVRLRGRWTIRNFLGGLRTLDIDLKPAFIAMNSFWDPQQTGPAVEASLRLTQPDAFYTSISLFTQIGYRLEVDWGYRYHGPQLQLGADRTFLAEDRLRVGLSWNLNVFDFFDVESTAFESSSTPLGLGFVDPYRVAWVEPFIQYDLRDVPFDPRVGAYGEVRFEYGHSALAGAFHYLKITPELRGYVPLGTRRIVLASRLLFGYLKELGREQSPVTRRYFLGGPSRHRGFTFGRLAPQGIASDGRRIPQGGNAALLVSFDLRVRVIQLFKHWLSAIAFTDGGEVSARISAMSIKHLHWAVGGGLQYSTPFGAITFLTGVRLNRLQQRDGSSRPNPDPGERLAFHLSLGAPF